MKRYGPVNRPLSLIVGKYLIYTLMVIRNMTLVKRR